MSDERQTLNILAMVTPNREAVGGGQPIMYANGEEEAASLASDVARALKADTFQLKNGVYLIVPTTR